MDPLSIELADAIQLIEAKRKEEQNSHLVKFEEDPELEVLAGRYGPYIKYKGANIAANIIKGGNTAVFAYDGTQFNLVMIDAMLDMLVNYRGKDIVYDTNS